MEIGNGSRPVPLTEPVPVPEIFATGRELVHSAGFVRLIYWSEHPLMFGGDPLTPTERQIVARIILPTDVWLALRMAARVANDQPA